MDVASIAGVEYYEVRWRRKCGSLIHDTYRLPNGHQDSGRRIGGHEGRVG